MSLHLSLILQLSASDIRGQRPGYLISQEPILSAKEIFKGVRQNRQRTRNIHSIIVKRIQLKYFALQRLKVLLKHPQKRRYN